MEKEQSQLQFCLIVERNKFLNYDYLDQRCNGLTYQILFRLARLGNPNIVFIVSWNEYHEQTAISPTKEYGFKYLDLTKELSERKGIAHSIA